MQVMMIKSQLENRFTAQESMQQTECQDLNSKEIHINQRQKHNPVTIEIECIKIGRHEKACDSKREISTIIQILKHQREVHWTRIGFHKQKYQLQPSEDYKEKGKVYGMDLEQMQIHSAPSQMQIFLRKFWTFALN